MNDAYHNNFHLLRLGFALLVMLSHGNVLFGLGYESAVFHAAEWAVNGFFILSGWLVSWSIDRGFAWQPYAIKRFARLYPLYAVVIVTQLALMVFCSAMPISLAEALRYLAANLLALNFVQPNVGDMVNGPINGSLWTIKIEILFYGLLPLFAMLARRFGWRFVLACWVAAFAYRYMLDDISIRWARQLPGAMTFFIAGYALHHYRPRMLGWFGVKTVRPIAAIAALAGLYALLPESFAAPLLHLVILMVFIEVVALRLPPMVPRRDLSYGIYLIHFPLFLGLQHLGVLQAHPLLAFAAGCAMVLVLALLATKAIEEPMIRWGKRKAKHYETNRAAL